MHVARYTYLRTYERYILLGGSFYLEVGCLFSKLYFCRSFGFRVAPRESNSTNLFTVLSFGRACLAFQKKAKQAMPPITEIIVFPFYLKQFYDFIITGPPIRPGTRYLSGFV